MTAPGSTSPNSERYRTGDERDYRFINDSANFYDGREVIVLEVSR